MGLARDSTELEDYTFDFVHHVDVVAMFGHNKKLRFFGACRCFTTTLIIMQVFLLI